MAVALVLQQYGVMDAPERKTKQFITYIAEPHELQAGRESVIELHFRVAEGYHVSSHAPGSELQIPTRVDLGAERGVRIGEMEYSAGSRYELPFQPAQTLNVYTSAFIVRLPVAATVGSHTLQGRLFYQACDKAACYPLKSLPLTIMISAR